MIARTSFAVPGPRFAWLIALSFLTVACTGSMVEIGGDPGGDDDGPAGLTAQELFTENVKPMLTACGGCHSGATPLATGFLGAGGDTGYYAAITTSAMVNMTTPATSVLYTHAHSPAGPPEFTPAQKTEVLGWLEQEAIERAP